MRSFDGVPAIPLSAPGEMTRLFTGRGLRDLRSCAEYLMNLPYGRTSSRGNLRQVVLEGRGTCSSKHALLVELAREQNVELRLVLAIFLMNQANTPGVGPVLTRHGLSDIPEAHCYVGYGGLSIDITGPPEQRAERTFVYEEMIEPWQIETDKPEFHRRFLQRWLAESTDRRGVTLDDLWRIREECIAALSVTDSAGLSPT